MAKQLKSLFFVLILCGGVLSGTTFAGNNTEKDACPMKFCKHTAEAANPLQQQDAANLCRTLNCTTPSPTSTVAATQMNFAPLLVILKNFSIFQSLLAPPSKDNSQPLFAKTARLKTFQPKYIQHQSFLI